jgi:hypothetical protein
LFDTARRSRRVSSDSYPVVLDAATDGNDDDDDDIDNTIDMAAYARLETTSNSLFSLYYTTATIYIYLLYIYIYIYTPSCRRLPPPPYAVTWHAHACRRFIYKTPIYMVSPPYGCIYGVLACQACCGMPPYFACVYAEHLIKQPPHICGGVVLLPSRRAGARTNRG